MKVSGFIDDGIKNAKQPKTVEAFKTMKGNVDAMFFNAGVADCETLNNFFLQNTKPIRKMSLT